MPTLYVGDLSYLSPFSESQFVSVFLSISTVILWSGPQRFLPGYSDSLPVAQTRQGLARGEKWVSRDGRIYNAFRSIPFAKQPVDGRRFKRPEALDEDDVWEGVADFNREAKPCYQPGLGGFNGREDCLKLSVYTPNTKPESPLPVMVWIHGGGFVVGNSGTISQGPAFLMDHDVIVVSISYRLGILGFLSLETDEAPGNLGMWDQRQALIWVRQNIASFGGDPDKVTIFGESAGSMSVHYHLLSPLTRSLGLFARAVSMSGSALAWWASIKRPQEKAKKLGMLLECENYDTDMAKLVECLRSKPMFDLMNTHPNFYQWKHLEQTQEPMTAWSPRVDPEAPLSFMPSEPIDLMTSGNFQHIPWIVGLTDDEGATRSSAFFAGKNLRINIPFIH